MKRLELKNLKFFNYLISNYIELIKFNCFNITDSVKINYSPSVTIN